MDRNADGMSDRNGEMSLSSTQAGEEFAKFAGGMAAVPANRLVEHVLKYPQWADS